MGKINLYDKTMIDNRKGENPKSILNINLKLKDGLGMEFTVC